MTERRAWIDVSPLEVRGVVELDGAPEHLFLEREGEAEVAPLGARYVGRVIRAAPRGSFVDLGEGPPGWVVSEARGYAQGAALEVEIAAEARVGKGPRLRVLGIGEGPPRRISPPLALEHRLRRWLGDETATIGRGRRAREAADDAQSAALAVVHDLGGGLNLAIEPTRALVAIDVDLGAETTASARRGADLRAVREAARLLRLKALGGTVVIDMAGLRNPAAPVRAEAKSAFAPDGDAVRIWPAAGPALLVVSKPHGRRPLAERLVEDGALSPASRAAEVMRDLEREAAADPGARLRIDTSPALGALLGAALARAGLAVHLARHPRRGPFERRYRQVVNNAARPCPVCGRPAEAALKPFCSRRCADVDLQRWFSGAYAIAGPAVAEPDPEEE